MTVIWDERLITRARAADACGEWEMYIDSERYLRCGQCAGNIGLLPSPGKILSADGIISLVLGHMVKCHDYPLSGGGNG